MRVSKREKRKFDAGRFDLKKLNDVIHNGSRLTSRTGTQLWRTNDSWESSLTRGRVRENMKSQRNKCR